MKHLFLIAGALVIALTTCAFAEVPQMINYQGKLTKPDGSLIADTTVSMEFKIYDDSIGGTILWQETQNSVQVKKGVFNVLLGSANSIPYTVLNGSARYLGVKVGSNTEMIPRKPISSVGYAFHSEFADTAEFAKISMPDDDWTISGNNIFRLEGNVGIGTTNPEERLHVQGVIRSRGHASDPYYADFASAYNYGESFFLSVRGGDAEETKILGFGFTDTWLSSYGASKALCIKGILGSVGIGTTSPGAKLDVSGSGVALHVTNTEDSSNFALIETGNTPGQYDFGAWGNGVFRPVRIDGSTLALQTRSGGNVGIGTTGPGAKLDVNGGIKGAPKTDSDSLSDALPIPDNVAYGFNATYSTDGGGMFAWYQGVLDHTDLAIWYGDDENADLRFLRGRWNGTYQDLTDVMTLTGTGNVGIGTTSPAYKFDVNGDIRATGNIYGNFSGTIDNADKVDGIHANTTPTANQLYPLDANTKIPNAQLYTGSGNGLDVDKVDGIHANTTPTANQLYPLDASAKIPNARLYTGSGNGLDADKVDGKNNGELTADIWDGHNWGDTYPSADNADKLDGIHGNQFLRNDQSGTLSGNLSISNDLAVHGRLDAYSYVDLKYYTDIWDLLVWSYITAYSDVLVMGDLTVWGTKEFAQLYPKDTTKTIHYVCLEGGEAGTYIRGSGQLQGGIAIISLPEHFGLVTGENGLTSQVTPRDGTAKGYLYVESVTPTQLVVKESGNGSSNAKFDYLVVCNIN